jgi:hypothetical protein
LDPVVERLVLLRELKLDVEWWGIPLQNRGGLGDTSDDRRLSRLKLRRSPSPHIVADASNHQNILCAGVEVVEEMEVFPRAVVELMIAKWREERPTNCITDP